MFFHWYRITLSPGLCKIGSNLTYMVMLLSSGSLSVKVESHNPMSSPHSSFSQVTLKSFSQVTLKFLSPPLLQK